MSETLEFAKDLALRAGARLRRGMAGPLDVRLKGPADIVTAMDTAADDLICGAIRERFPAHAILAEESGLHEGSADRWLVDPLDGTLNYAHRWPHWAVSIALARAAEVVLGVVYAPATGELFWAERGHGAFRDGKRLCVSPVESLASALLNVGSLTLDPDTPLRDQPVGRLLASAFKVRQIGACSLDLAWLAAGRVDACIQGWTTPWDVGAGKILVEEAGGRLTRLDGATFALDDTAFIASNGRLHEAMAEVLSCRT